MKQLSALFFSLFILFTTPALACEKVETTDKTLKISHVWGKPNYGPNGAAYFTLKNEGKKERHLIAASSALSPRVELHTHTHEDGVMKMRHMKDGVTIKPGETVQFKPAGKHVMLLGMKGKFKDGGSYKIQLEFKDGTKEVLKVKVMNNGPKSSKAEDKRGSHADDEHRGSHEDGDDRGSH
jgi:hypothetical protein